MTFRNSRFPLAIKYGAVSTAMYSTDIAKAVSGSSVRNSNWDYPLHKFNVTRAAHTDALREELLAFFHNMQGAGNTFRIRDHSDYQVSIAQGVFTSLGNSRYQMWKRYTTDAYTVDVPIYLPVSGTIAVTGYTESTHYTIDYTTPAGVVTMLGSPSPAAPTAWSGQFDIHARFENDELPITIEDAGLHVTGQIVIVEERNRT